MENLTALSDDINVKIHKKKKESTQKQSFAKELMRGDEELRNLKNRDDEDFKQRVDDMIEEINRLETMKSTEEDDYEKAPVEVCSECDEDILEDALIVGSDAYHEKCFTCDHCGCSLTGKFYQMNNKKYCEKDQEVGLSTCTLCGDFMRSGSLLVGGKAYHPTCLVCSECKQPLQDKFYTTEEGNWLCEEHYRLTKPACHSCKLPVMERMLTAMDRQFHPACFTCCNCSTILDGKPFMAEEGLVYCRDCYARHKAPKCFRCEQPIVSSLGKRMTLITCNSNKYHYQCYACKHCEKNLNGIQVFLDGDDVACGECKMIRNKI